MEGGGRSVRTRQAALVQLALLFRCGHGERCACLSCQRVSLSRPLGWRAASLHRYDRSRPRAFQSGAWSRGITAQKNRRTQTASSVSTIKPVLKPPLLKRAVAIYKVDIDVGAGEQMLDEPKPKIVTLIPTISLLTATAFVVRAIRRRGRCDRARLNTRTSTPASSLSPTPAQSERESRNRND